MKYIIIFLFSVMSLNSFSQVPPRNRPGYCPLVQSSSCENLVISRLPRWDYDEEYEYDQIRNSCSGNYGTSCLGLLINNVPRWDSNNLYSLSTLAQSCQLTNPQCVHFIASKIPRFEFNNIYAVTEVATACARANVTCMQRRCSTRDYYCNRKPDLLRAARNCYQQCYK